MRINLGMLLAGSLMIVSSSETQAQMAVSRSSSYYSAGGGVARPYTAPGYVNSTTVARGYGGPVAGASTYSSSSYRGPVAGGYRQGYYSSNYFAPRATSTTVYRSYSATSYRRTGFPARIWGAIR